MSTKIERNDPCWCGSGQKYKKCHMALDEKIQKYAEQGFTVPGRAQIKSAAQIEAIRESCKVNTAVLDYVASKIGPGISTEEIDRWVYEKTKELGGIPAPLNYEGFPKSVCTSINDQVCHGIPSETDILKEGDIVNVDVSTIYRGFFSDASRMFMIGEVSEDARRLVEVVRECVRIGVEHVKPWRPLGDMGSAVHEHAMKNGYSVVREIGGHGVGIEFHEDPWVSYVSKPGTEMLMVPGMIFTIEPMVNAGARDIYVDSDNHWTVYTKDGSLSAQWEVTVLVTEDGCDVIAW